MAVFMCKELSKPLLQNQCYMQYGLQKLLTTKYLKKMELIKEHNWPNEPRLKMIAKSEFYYGSEKVYQYGFYDGYQYQNKEIINLQKRIIELELLLSKANIDSSPLNLDSKPLLFNN